MSAAEIDDGWLAGEGTFHGQILADHGQALYWAVRLQLAIQLKAVGVRTPERWSRQKLATAM